MKRYLADTSALLRLGRPEIDAIAAELVLTGLVRICTAVVVELSWYLNGRGPLVLRQDLECGFEVLPVLHRDWLRALDVQARIWRIGYEAPVGFAVLLISAVAERERLTLLHDDADFEMVRLVTGQPARRLVSYNGPLKE